MCDCHFNETEKGPQIKNIILKKPPKQTDFVCKLTEM